MLQLGLYVHIPFCQQKCLYCDFPSYGHLTDLYGDYVTALCREISAQSGILSQYTIDSIFIGGGTPTLLPEVLWDKLLRVLYQNMTVSPELEFSVEANPGTVSRDKLAFLRAAGINRISFGVQSFSDTLLRGIGRQHSSEQARQAIAWAAEAGFANVNLDLMYGLPGQSLRDLQDSLQTAVDTGCQHLSVYGLKIEEGTPFAGMQAEGRLALPDEEEEEAMYQWVTAALPHQGYQRYEISNYAQAGYACRHNLKYWQYQPYLGLGAAAHSFIAGRRFGNMAAVRPYIEAVRAQRSPQEFSETPAAADAMAEFIFLALRTSRGVSFNEFSRHFHASLTTLYRAQVDKLQQQQLLSVDDQGIRLTPLGMKYGNRVFASFLPAD